MDRSEEEPDSTMNINALGPKPLAQASKKFVATLVHFGSEYVFEGLKQDASFGEEDATNPINQYEHKQA